MSFAKPPAVMAIGYAFALALIVFGWHGPLLGLGLLLFVILTLINVISLVALGCFAWQISSRTGPDDPEFMDEHMTSPMRIIAYGLGGVVAAGLLVASFLVFVQTGGFAP